MAKLINVLAASVGGGLMLGAGIRLGEAIAGGYAPVPGKRDLEGKLSARLGTLENRLRNLESGGFADSAVRLEKQAAEVASIRSQLGTDERQIEALSEIGQRLRTELQGWLEENVGSRMAEVESKLRAESEQSQKHTLDTFVDGVQTRVIQRIARLEEEVTGQSAAMTELRECSLRTEQSLQKLLGGLERLMAERPAPPAHNAATTEKPEPPAGLRTEWEVKPPASLAAEEPARKSRRWGIFG